MSNASSNNRRKTGTLPAVATESLEPQPEDNANILAHASPHKPAAVRVPWNPLLAVGFVVVLFLTAQLIAGFVAQTYAVVQHWDVARTREWLTSSVGAQFGYTLLAQALVIGGLYLFLRHYKTGFKILGLVKPQAKDILYALSGFAAYFAAYALILVSLKLLVPSFDTDQKQEIGFDNATGLLPLTLTFISLVILPPLVEEILMRGFLFGSLRKYLRFVWAMLITGVVFASAHLPEGGAAGPLWVAGVDTFVLSFILCHLRERTGRLWAGIGVHALKNSVAFFALFVLHLS